MIGCLRTRVRNQPIIALYFESENVLKLYNLEAWCLVMVEPLFLGVPRGCLQFVIVVFPDDTHLLFLICLWQKDNWIGSIVGSCQLIMHVAVKQLG